MKIKLEIENFKKIKNLKTEFQDSKLHLIKGNNNLGKSTILQAISSLLNAKLDVPNPLSFGEENGNIIGIIEDTNGNKWSVTLDFDNKKSKFTLVNPDGIKSTSVTSIRDFFAYSSFTAEEFLSWGATADGRKKQVKYLLECISEDGLTKYNSLTELEEKLYADRTPVFEEEKYLKRKLDEFKIDDLTKELLKSDRNTVEKKISQHKSEFEEIKTTKEKSDDIKNEMKKYEEIYNNQIRDFNTKIQTHTLFINDYQNQIKELLKKIDQQNQIIENFNKEKSEKIINYEKYVKETEKKVVIIDKDKYALLEDNYKKAISMEEMLSKAISLEENLNKIQSELDIVSEKKQQLTDNIENIRGQKKDVLKSEDVIEGLFIEEDGLYIQNEDGYFPLNDKQISTSTSMKIAVKILLKLNKKFPIITIGRAESLSEENLNYINKLAEEHNAIIIAEKVTQDDNIEIEMKINE